MGLLSNSCSEPDLGCLTEQNPGYNQNGGPVLVPGLRIHIEDSLNAWRVSR